MATTSRSTADTADDKPVQQAKEAVRDAADTVRTVANEAAARLPEAAATTRDALADARRTIDSGSDETLSAGTLVAFGFALGPPRRWRQSPPRPCWPSCPRRRWA